MKTKSEESRKRLKKAIKNFNISAATIAITEMETEDVSAVLDEAMAQPGAYQIHEERTKRNRFYDALLNLSVMSEKHEAVRIRAEELNRKIKIVERCFDEIRDTLPKCAISDFSGDIQFWSHVDRASGELTRLDRAARKQLGKFEARLKRGVPTVAPEAVMVKLDHGTVVDVDATYSGIIDALSLTLKMLSYEQDLLHDGKLVAPVKPLITEDHIFKSGSIQLFAVSWNSLEDAANRTLFFGGEIGSAQDAGLSLEHMPAEVRAKFPDPIIFYRQPTDSEVFDFLANRRLHTYFMQNAMLITNGVAARGVVMTDGMDIPDLATGFVSEDEVISLSQLSEILAYNVFEDQERFHGLTLREWVRGYCALGLMAAAKQKDNCLVSFEKGEIEQGLRDYKLPADCVQTLIYHLTFGRDSRDLYDSPLIYSQDEKYTLFANVLTSCNITNVLFSRLSSLTTQFDKKGKGFESRVVSSFVSWGYTCKSIKFKRDKDEYEYDALLLIDDTLLVIECKNNLLSGNNSVQAFRYAKALEENIGQVKRLVRGLYEHPDVVESLFQRKIEDLVVLPVLLNSMTYSRVLTDGVYITDWSALSKFFKESTVSQFGMQDGKKINKKTVHTLWRGKRPTVKELLDYLRLPIQLKVLIRHLRADYFERPMSETSLFFARVIELNEEKLHKAREKNVIKKAGAKKKRARRKRH